MSIEIEKGKMRVSIRSADADSRDKLIPASLFKKTFNTFLDALKAADKEISGKKTLHEFYVADLRMGSNIFAIEEKIQSNVTANSAVALFHDVAQHVYRSEFESAASFPDLSKKIIAISKIYNSEYVFLAEFDNNKEIPIDRFFVDQVGRLEDSIVSIRSKPSYFVGSAIGAFDGRLGNVDYRRAVWTGHLLLNGSEIQIECIFDKSKGEDAYNPFGNKRVSITGRAIYTGDSALPERIEVMSIEQIDTPISARDIRHTLKDKNYMGWNDDFDAI